MNRISAAMILPLVLMLTVGTAAAYGADVAEVTVPGDQTPGTITEVTVSGCQPGENVTFALPGGGSTVVVCDATENASTSVTVPDVQGDFTASLETTDVVLTYVLGIAVTAPATDALALTGTNISYPLYLAVGAMLIGGALVFVSKTRREDDATV